MLKNTLRAAVCACAAFTLACTSAPTTSGAQLLINPEEHAYLHLMAEHQKLGVSLAQQALTQGSANEVKDLARRLQAAENQDLNQLIGLGAAPPDGRESPEQEARTPARPEPSGPPLATHNLVGQTGPGSVAPGKKSYDKRWIQAYEAHHKAGLNLVRDYRAKLTSQSLQMWTNQFERRERAQLAEIRALRVL